MNRTLRRWAAAAVALLVAMGGGALGAQASSNGSVPSPMALTTYTNDEHHFSLKYPSHLAPTFGFTTQQSWSFLDVGDANGRTMTIDLYDADNSSEGGGRSKAYFAITRRVQIGISPEVAGCTATSGNTLPTAEEATINGVRFTVLRADPTAFASMHVGVDGTSYRAVHAGACFAIENVTLISRDMGSEEPPRIAAGAESADREADAMIHSFRFTDLPTGGASPVAPSTGAISIPAGTTRVAFAEGATEGVVSGVIDAGATIGYLVGSSSDQPLLLDVESTNRDLTLSVTSAESHTPLPNMRPASNLWQALSPYTGDYFVEIHGGSASEHYRLAITIPARITFARGEVSARRTGRTPGGLPVDYVLRVQGGQALSLALHTSGGVGVLRVFALQDGAAEVRASDRRTSARVTLQQPADCVVEVVPADETEIQFTLDVTVPPGRG